MVHRLALTIGGLGAVGVLGLALVAGGTPLAVSSASATADPSVEALAGEDRNVKTVVDTVYVRPGDVAAVSDGRRSDDSADPTASPQPTSSPRPTSTPEPARSPDASFEAFDDDDGHSGRGHDGDDDRSGHDDSDFDDHSGHGGGDDDRSGHRDGDDDRDDDGDDDHGDDDRHGDDD